MRRLVAFAMLAALPAGAETVFHAGQRVRLEVTGLVVELPGPGSWELYSVRASPTGSADDAYDALVPKNAKLLVEVRFLATKSCEEWRVANLPDGTTRARPGAYWPADAEMYERTTDAGVVATGCARTESGLLEAVIYGDPSKVPLVAKLTAAIIASANAGTGRSVRAQPWTGPYTLDDALAGLAGHGPLKAVIDTSLGRITCTLDDRHAPIAVANFIGLARGLRPFLSPKEGWVTRRFYDGLTFHRVIPGFVIQGGDLAGDGTGGVGYTIKNEDKNGLVFDRPGRLATARGGDPDSAGGQFFITDAPTPHLDHNQTIFGDCGPISTIHTIASAPRGSDDKPRKLIEIDSVTITH
jgi:peptidyl-prolyl cis-trans isomerase A (cyclophilin A)